MLPGGTCRSTQIFIPCPAKHLLQKVEPTVKPLLVFVEVEVRVDLLEVARHLVASNRSTPLGQRLDVVFRRVQRQHRAAQLFSHAETRRRGGFVLFVAKITIRIFYLVVLIVARELVERERLDFERRYVELDFARHILEAERNAGFADRSRAEVGFEDERRPVEVAALVVGLRPLFRAGRRVAVVEHELQAKVGFVRPPDAAPTCADRGADAARQAAEVDFRVGRATAALAVRVDDNDIARPRRVATEHPFDARRLHGVRTRGGEKSRRQHGT